MVFHLSEVSERAFGCTCGEPPRCSAGLVRDTSSPFGRDTFTAGISSSFGLDMEENLPV